MKLSKSIEMLLCITTSICVLLSVLMVDELCKYSSDINSYCDLVLPSFGIKGQLILTIVILLELFLNVIVGIVTGAEWLLDNIGDLSLTECILIRGIISSTLMKTIDLNPLAKLSGLGLFGIIATYVLLAHGCIQKQVNITAAVLFGNLFIQVHKYGYGVSVIISIFCVHTFVPALLKSGMQNPRQFRQFGCIIYFF